MLQSDVMPTTSTNFDENPSLDGPDYVALVIEWDVLADDLERKLQTEPYSHNADPITPHLDWQRYIGIAAGTLGAFALLWRVVHRLRA